MAIDHEPWEFGNPIFRQALVMGFLGCDERSTKMRGLGTVPKIREDQISLEFFGDLISISTIEMMMGAKRPNLQLLLFAPCQSAAAADSRQQAMKNFLTNLVLPPAERTREHEANSMAVEDYSCASKVPQS